ncbi:FxsA family protein [Oceanicella actignis]|uniref:FxsA family protein n=1 Tax=Oceanicella actignis TaxID=1189325 RepID=UPI0011E70BD3|nr:FxsA family protein [Oceanicella actignis]TYO88885.1 UPF0716 protein FxsA [Oceanicella actignis]
MWLFLILVAVPIVEIALFIKVGGFLGLWPTLAIVLATAAAGTLLLRAQGREAIDDLQRSLTQGGDPAGALAHGALVLAAGLLLLTPGFFTDAVGLALLIRPVRAAVIRWASRHMAARMEVHVHAARTGPGPGPAGEDEVIDADFVVLDEDGRPRPEPDPDARRVPPR